MTRILFIFFALCWTQISWARDIEVPIKFELTLSSTTLNVGDSLPIRLKIQNPLNKSITFHLDDGYLANYLKLIDRAGRIMPWERISLYDRPWEKLTTHTLKPYESFTIYLQPSLIINDFNELVLDFVHSQIVLTRPGEYDVVGFLRGYDLDKINNMPGNDEKKDNKKERILTEEEKNKPILFLDEAYSNALRVKFLR